MAVDILQDVFDTLRLQGLIAGVYAFDRPWGYATTPGSHDIAFVFMVAGGGILELGGQDQGVRTEADWMQDLHNNGVLEVAQRDSTTHILMSGDIVVLPQRMRYTLRDTVHSPVLPFSEMQAQRQRVGASATRIASGCFRFVDRSRKPVLSALPPIIHLHQEDYQSVPELDLLMRLFLVEAVHDGSSQPAILTRLAEVCFMQMLRLFATQTLESTSGWLRGLADPPIAAALQAIHADPAAPWTVERLASAAHLSRSSFAERFKTLVGETPLQYVQRWRMQRAAHLLDEGNQPLKTIIALSGYASEAAFRKAFHHWIGVLPSAYHKAYSE